MKDKRLWVVMQKEKHDKVMKDLTTVVQAENEKLLNEIKNIKNSVTTPDNILNTVKKELNEKYRGCQECILFSKDKVDKYNQTPEALTSLYPGEKLSIDFFEVHSRDAFVVVDWVNHISMRAEIYGCQVS